MYNSNELQTKYYPGKFYGGIMATVTISSLQRPQKNRVLSISMRHKNIKPCKTYYSFYEI